MIAYNNIITSACVTLSELDVHFAVLPETCQNRIAKAFVADLIAAQNLSVSPWGWEREEEETLSYLDEMLSFDLEGLQNLANFYRLKIAAAATPIAA